MHNEISLVQVEVYFAKAGMIFTDSDRDNCTFPMELQDEDLELVDWHKDLDSGEQIVFYHDSDRDYYRLINDFHWMEFRDPFGELSQDYYSCPLSWELENIGWDDIFEPYADDVVKELVEYGRTLLKESKEKSIIPSMVNFVIGFNYVCERTSYPYDEVDCWPEYLGVLDFNKLSFLDATKEGEQDEVVVLS